MINQYHVTYYYLATGMEGYADVRDYGIIYASTSDEAVEKAIDKHGGAKFDKATRAWVKGCITAKKIPW